MDVDLVKRGLRVLTNAELDDTRGMSVRQIHLDNRKPNTEGTVMDYVPGHGGDVWWISHDDGSIAAYSFEEFEIA